MNGRFFVQTHLRTRGTGLNVRVSGILIPLNYRRSGNCQEDGFPASDEVLLLLSVTMSGVNDSIGSGRHI
jgi:hypothetical protein